MIDSSLADTKSKVYKQTSDELMFEASKEIDSKHAIASDAAPVSDQIFCINASQQQGTIAGGLTVKLNDSLQLDFKTFQQLLSNVQNTLGALSSNEALAVIRKLFSNELTETDLSLFSTKPAVFVNLIQSSMPEPVKEDPMPAVPDINTNALEPKLNFKAVLPRSVLLKMTQNRLTYEEIYSLLDICSEATNGIIQSYKVYRVHKAMKKKVGEKYCATSTRYVVHKRLEQKGYIKISNGKLILNDYEESFAPGSKGVFPIPKFIFSEEFKNVVKSVDGLMLSLYFAYRIGDIYGHKTIGFSMPEAKSQNIRLTKKVLAEVSKYFMIKDHGHKRYSVSYFSKDLIKNKKDLEGIAQPLHIIKPVKWRRMIEISKKLGLFDLLKDRERRCKNAPGFENLSLSDAFNSIISTLHLYNYKQIKSILSLMCAKLRNVSDLPKSIIAYIKTLIKNHILIKNRDYVKEKVHQCKKDVEELQERGWPKEHLPVVLISDYEYWLRLLESLDDNIPIAATEGSV